jgi:hypothetical protein
MSTSDTMITIVRARCRRLAKIVSADGTIQDYDKPYRFDLAEVLVTGLDGSNGSSAASNADVIVL